MNANDLRDKVTIVDPGTNSDGYDDAGSPPVSYPIPVATGLYAKVEDLSGLELIRAKKIIEKVTHRIKIRYGLNVTVSMQVQHGSKLYDVQYVMDLGVPRRNWFETLLCVEHQAT
jgi:SPP1 family predicted phage head-tail adaptor